MPHSLKDWAINTLRVTTQPLNGKGRMHVPRTWGDLKEALDKATNAKILMTNVETEEGQEMRLLISAITQKLWKNPNDNDCLDEGTRNQVAELLDRLDMLGHCTIESVLRRHCGKNRMTIAELLPQEVRPSTTDDEEGDISYETAPRTHLSEVA